MCLLLLLIRFDYMTTTTTINARHLECISQNPVPWQNVSIIITIDLFRYQYITGGCIDLCLSIRLSLCLSVYLLAYGFMCASACHVMLCYVCSLALLATIWCCCDLCEIEIVGKIIADVDVSFKAMNSLTKSATKKEKKTKGYITYKSLLFLFQLFVREVTNKQTKPKKNRPTTLAINLANKQVPTPMP